MKNLFLFFLLCCLAIPLWSQTMSIDTFYNPLLPDIEVNSDYGFVWPVNADILNETNYSPSSSNRYFMSIFGPRYYATSSSNIEKYDFHQGADISPEVSWDGVDYTDTVPKYSIICMCDGVINDIIDSTDVYLETLGTGRSVKVKCDSSFRANADWGPIYITYRHLSALGPLADSAKSLPDDSVRIYRGDTIGTVGESGQTSNVHLHLSVQRYEQGAPGDDLKNMHTMRIFPTDTAPHLLQGLDTINFELLQHWTDSALFRLAVPYNQVNFKRIEVRNESYYRYFDFEDVSDSSDRDHNDVIDGLALYAYSFNRGSTALSRYNSTKGDMPIYYPASPNRDTVTGWYTHYPITFDTTIYVLDIMIRDLDSGYDTAAFQIKVSDIYGNTVVGYFEPASTDTLTWIGCKDSIWSDPSNWNARQVPDSSNVVYIPGSNKVPYMPWVTSADAVCKEVLLDQDNGAVLYIAFGGHLEIKE